MRSVIRFLNKKKRCKKNKQQEIMVAIIIFKHFYYHQQQDDDGWWLARVRHHPAPFYPSIFPRTYTHTHHRRYAILPCYLAAPPPLLVL